MDLSAPHIGFVIASYLVSAFVLAGLVVITLIQNRTAKRRLEALNQRRAQRAVTPEQSES